MNPVLVVAAGGALGAIGRYGVNMVAARILGTNFPYGTLLANIVGCFFMGILIGLFTLREPTDPALKLFLVTGILGGFTTFSAFSAETIMLAERKPSLALAYVLASVLLSLAACWTGLRIIQSTSA